jgi:hypothetical protein
MNLPLFEEFMERMFHWLNELAEQREGESHSICRVYVHYIRILVNAQPHMV